MKKKRFSPEIEETHIELVPLIDCVFLLLIFFMCSATMSRVDITPEVALPEAPKAAVPEDSSGRGRVNILPIGATTPDNHVVTAEKPFLVFGTLMDDKTLESAIRDQIKQIPKLKLYLRVDKNVPFSMVRRAITACANAGVYDIIFATFPGEEGQRG